MENHFKINKYLLFIFIFISLFLLTSIYDYQYGLNFFDQGSFLNKIIRIENGFYFESIKGHFQPILIFLSLVSKNFDLGLKSFFLLFIQSFFLSLPILFFNHKVRLLYASSFIIWSAAFVGFHPDSLSLIFIYFYFILKSNYKFLALVILLCIKEIFIFCFLMHSLTYLLNKNYKGFLVTFLISFTFFVIYIYCKNNFVTHFNLINYSFESALSLEIFNQTLIIKLIFFIFLYGLFDFQYKNIKEYLFFFSPLLIFNLFTKNVNYIMPFYHYFLIYLIPVCLSYEKNGFSKILNFKIYLSIYVFLNFLISYSPISIRFLFIENSPYNIDSYLEDNIFINNEYSLREILKDIKKDDLILVENNAYFSELNKSLFVIPINDDYLNYYDEIIYDTKRDGNLFKFNKANLIVLSNKEINFKNDIICQNCRDNLVNQIKNKGYNEVFRNHKIKVFK